MTSEADEEDIRLVLDLLLDGVAGDCTPSPSLRQYQRSEL